MKLGKAIALSLALGVALWTAGCDREPSEEPSSPTSDARPTPTESPVKSIESLHSTATAQVVAQSKRPTPTPFRHLDYSCPFNEPELNIDKLAFVRFPEDMDPHLQWTPDGERLVFNENHTNIRVVDAQGSEIRSIVNMYPGGFKLPPFSLSLDLSTDGSRIVYSSCEFDNSIDQDRQGSDSSQSMVQMDSFGRDGSWYEIASIGIDGTSPKRLTENDYMDHYPAWSPDGTQIAFVAVPRFYERLFTMPADGSEEPTTLTGDDLRIRRLPPVWSPDGEFLAFFAQKGGEGEFSANILHTARPDGSDLTRIGYSTALPVWSPDSGELIFARTNEIDESPGKGEAVIYSVRPDGTGIQRVWSSGARPYEYERSKRSFPLVLQLSRSPDGSKLMFLYLEEEFDRDDRYFGVYLLNADGSSLRRLAPFETFVFAAWSPDGSRIAVLDLVNRDEEGSLIIVSPETGEVRLLAMGDRTNNFTVDGRFRVLNKPRPDMPVKVSGCSEGSAISNLESHSGLVRDCETLLTIGDALSWDVDLNWNGQIPMGEWEGVTIECCPSRVSELSLSDHGLTGVIPPEIGQLTSLVSLDLSSNWLSGTIPREIGQLMELENLDLAENWLTGAIPPGLGGLRTLHLGRNYLSGTIPPDLGSQGMLERLHLNDNFLTGYIPEELGTRMSLQELYIQNNNLSGNIPPELGSLSRLMRLDLSNNWLEGQIPPELGDLSRLYSLSLYNYQLEGCVPAKLWEMDRSSRRMSGLQRCDEAVQAGIGG